VIPDVSEVLNDWAITIKRKVVTTITVDFETVQSVQISDISAVVQPAEMEKLNPATIDWSREYLQIHTAAALDVGDFIEYDGRDFKIVQRKAYGHKETVAEETKRPLIEPVVSEVEE
jgi:hypothetical protein